MSRKVTKKKQHEVIQKLYERLVYHSKPSHSKAFVNELIAKVLDVKESEVEKLYDLPEGHPKREQYKLRWTDPEERSEETEDDCKVCGGLDTVFEVNGQQLCSFCGAGQPKE